MFIHHIKKARQSFTPHPTKISFSSKRVFHGSYRIVFSVSAFTLLHSESPKLHYNFGLSECNRAKVNGYTLKGSNYHFLFCSLSQWGLSL